MPGTVAGLVWSSYEISSTGRPRRPPFLLTSSFQIWMARSAGLPLAESPPVSAMPKPILIGSAARAVNAPALASTSVTTTAPTRVQVIDRLQDCFMPSLPLCAPRVGGGPQTAPGVVGLSRPSRPVLGREPYRTGGRATQTAPSATSIPRLVYHAYFAASASKWLPARTTEISVTYRISHAPLPVSERVRLVRRVKTSRP